MTGDEELRQAGHKEHDAAEPQPRTKAVTKATKEARRDTKGKDQKREEAAKNRRHLFTTKDMKTTKKKYVEIVAITTA